MRRLFAITAFLALAGFGLASPAGAQQFGAQLNWGDNTDLGIGARAQFDLGSMIGSDNEVVASLKGAVSGDYYFWDCDPFDCSYFEINGNALYPFDLGGDAQLDPYVGTGLNLAFADFAGVSDTDVGLNLLGGATFDLGGFDAFAEAKQEIGGGDQFVLTFGVMVGGGG